MVKSDCEHIENLIPLYIDNMLSEEENDILCEHIKSCPECAENLKFLKSMMAVAKDAPEISVPEDFHSNLMNGVRKEAAKKSLGLLALKRTIVGFAAAAAVVALSVTAHINLNENKVTQNPDDFITPIPAQQTTDPEENEVVTPEPEETEEPSAKPESKKNVSKNVVDASKNVSSKSEATLPAESTEETDAPSTFSRRENEGISVARMSGCRVIKISVYESEREKAEKLLKGLEKDETGYKLSQENEKILEELAKLEGFSSREEVNETIDCDYIILK